MHRTQFSPLLCRSALMPGQACFGRSRPHCSRFHKRILETKGPWSHLPLDCWYNVLQFSEPLAIMQFAALNKACKEVAYDTSLWKPHFTKTWSPEYSGSLQTKPAGKDFRSLYSHWQTGQPAAVELVTGVHRSVDGPNLVEEIQLCQAGALVAWSVGRDDALVGTDMTTCHVLKRFLPEKSNCGDLCGVTVLDSKGLVCAGGTHITGWDPRQPGNGPSATPAFSVEFTGVHGAEDYSIIHTMIPAASPEGSGLLTGGTEECYLWDLRNMDQPMREYESIDGGVSTILREPRHGTLLAGGVNGITCSDFNTGALLSVLRTAPESLVLSSLAAGRDRLISVDDETNITEWALPDPHAIVEEPEPRWVRAWPATPHQPAHSVVVQGLGLGEDLPRILVGTSSGSICTWECVEDPEEPPIYWSLGDHVPVAVNCLTATDQLVVLGLTDGALRVMRLS